MNSDALIDTNPKTLVSVSETMDIVTWSDEKRNDFVKTFNARVEVARFILCSTARYIIDSARNRKFISDKHISKLPDFHHYFPRFHYGEVGGRDVNDLNEIAKARAKEVLSNLPPLKDAVKVIDPATAKMLDRMEVLKQQGEKIKDQVEEASDPIIMAELDQNMTIGEFSKLVKDRDKKRRQLLDKLNEVSREGRKLDETISKNLYKGLPGLSEAVIDVVVTHIDQSKALDTMGRRVEEQIKFGDSEVAIEILRHFEKDEAEVSQKVADQFSKALDKLKLSVKKSRAAKSGKKELRA